MIEDADRITLFSEDDCEIERSLNNLTQNQFLKHDRIVEKDGTINVKNKPKNSWSQLYDYNILLQMQWVSFIVLSVVVFMCSFAIFAAGIMLVIDIHPIPKNGTNLTERELEIAYIDRVSGRCFVGLDDGFISAFMLGTVF